MAKHRLTDNERDELTELANRVLEAQPITYEEYERFVQLTQGQPTLAQYNAYCTYVEEKSKEVI